MRTRTSTLNTKSDQVVSRPKTRLELRSSAITKLPENLKKDDRDSKKQALQRKCIRNSEEQNMFSYVRPEKLNEILLRKSSRQNRQNKRKYDETGDANESSSLNVKKNKLSTEINVTENMSPTVKVHKHDESVVLKLKQNKMKCGVGDGSNSNIKKNERKVKKKPDGDVEGEINKQSNSRVKKNKFQPTTNIKETNNILCSVKLQKLNENVPRQNKRKCDKAEINEACSSNAKKIEVQETSPTRQTAKFRKLDESVLDKSSKQNEINFSEGGDKKENFQEVNNNIQQRQISPSETSPPVMRNVKLRKRKDINYRESRSSTPTPQGLNESNTVPVYKRLLQLDKLAKPEKNDPYAFVPDPVEKESDPSFKIKTVQKKRRSPKKKLSPERRPKKIAQSTYGQKISSVLDRVWKNVKEKKLKSSNEESFIKSNESGGGKRSSERLEIIENVLVTRAKQIDKTKDVQNEKLDSPAEHELRNENIDDDNGSFLMADGNDCDSEHDDLSSLIEFYEDKSANETINYSNRIVSSDVTSPRRLDENYFTKNPHLLYIKKNALPALNQDPILDHTYVDRMSDVSATIANLTANSSRVLCQQSILDYVNSNVEKQKNVTQKSKLYDMEEINVWDEESPENKENLERPKTSPSKSKMTRVFRSLDKNIQTSTPIKHKSIVPINLDLSVIGTEKKLESFGFNSMSSTQDLNEENAEAPKPFRFEAPHPKQYKSKHLITKYAEPVAETELQRLAQNEDDDSEDKNLRVGLFEDCEDDQNKSGAHHKLRAKKHFGGKEEKTKKKNPEKLSKEAWKWIKEFRKMCDEVDKVQLEIE